MEVIMEEQQTLGELIQQTYDWLVAAKYSKGTVYSFKCITNQLKTYAAGKNEIYFSMDLALSFLEDHYHLSSDIRNKKPWISYASILVIGSSQRISIKHRSNRISRVNKRPIFSGALDMQ